jgi:hypothetical protein
MRDYPTPVRHTRNSKQHHSSPRNISKAEKKDGPTKLMRKKSGLATCELWFKADELFL